MKRSEINLAWDQAKAFFTRHHWHLPPNARVDITDLGLGRFKDCGLVLVNLAEEPEYCEKLMYARKNQLTPAHAHKVKKEDIICRIGELTLQLWARHPKDCADGEVFAVNICGEARTHRSGDKVTLKAGERVTLVPGVYHSFYPETDECIIGEVSTANDDANDNFFVDDGIGRFPDIEEDAPVTIRLLSEKA